MAKGTTTHVVRPPSPVLVLLIKFRMGHRAHRQAAEWGLGVGR